MTPLRILGGVAIVAAATVALLFEQWSAAVFVVGVLLIIGIALVTTARPKAPERPGYLDPAVFSSPPCEPHSVATGLGTPTEWLVEFELWPADLRSAVSIEVMRLALERVVAGRAWESWDDDSRDVLHYRVQVLASNHDVALRLIERAAEREAVAGLNLRNLSACPGTITTNNRSHTA